MKSGYRDGGLNQTTKGLWDIRQSDALGVRRDFATMDNNNGKRNIPMAVLELRTFGERNLSIAQVKRNVEILADVARAADSAARSEAGGRSRRLPSRAMAAFDPGSTRLSEGQDAHLQDLGRRVAERMVQLAATGTGRVAVTLTGFGEASWFSTRAQAEAMGQQRAGLVAVTLRGHVTTARNELVPDGTTRVTADDLLIQTRSAGLGDSGETAETRRRVVIRIVDPGAKPLPPLPVLPASP